MEVVIILSLWRKGNSSDDKRIKVSVKKCEGEKEWRKEKRKDAEEEERRLEVKNEERSLL